MKQPFIWWLLRVATLSDMVPNSKRSPSKKIPWVSSESPVTRSSQSAKTSSSHTSHTAACCRLIVMS